MSGNASNLVSSFSFSAVSAENEQCQEDPQNVSHLILKPQKTLKEKYRLDYKPTDYVIEHIDVKFELHDHHTKVSSKLLMHRRENTPISCDLKLDGENLQLTKVEIDGRELKYGLPNSSNTSANEEEKEENKKTNNNENNGYTYEEDGIGLIINSKFLPKEPLKKFTVYTEIFINPIENLQLMGLYKSGKLFCTQCEAEGFRRITYFIDRPDIMATYRVTIEGDKNQCKTMLSNGNMVEHGELTNDKNRHYVVFDDPHPKPSYLFAIVAGELHSIKDTFITKSGRNVHLEILSEKEDVNKLDWAMVSIKKAFKWDEDSFDLEYDLDSFYIVCAKDFNMGAMENKGLNIFNSALLLADDKTTDGEYQRIMNVIGHEYFHNWTGNRVTCQDWFQLTLKEGLTVFRDQLFTSDMYSHAEKRIQDVVFLKSHQFAEDAGPMSHPIRPEFYFAMDNFYTATVYDKGAEVIRMYQTILGKEGFKKGMKLYFQRHDGKAVTCEDFRLAMADANNFDLTQFERWYLQAGTPAVEVVDAEHIADKKKYKITFSQSTPPTPKQPVKLPLHIPIRIGLIGKNSKKDLIEYNTILHLKEEKQAFEIPNVDEDCIPSILRDFSAPVKLKNKYESDEDLAFLMAYDSDDFNRWEASQKFATKIILERVNNFRKIYEAKVIEKKKEKELAGAAEHQHIDNDFDIYDNFDNEINGDVLKSYELKKTSSLFIQSFKTCLLSDHKDMALQAFSLSLPDEHGLSNEIRPLDPILLQKASQSIRREIYSELKNEILGKYNELTMKNDYKETLEKKDIARRVLRNLLLYYITSTKDENAADIAHAHYMNAKCMTDRLAGLRMLTSIDSPRKENALRHFYELANGDALTLDKWFSIQATSDRRDCLEEVKKLKSHSDFNEKNPNRCRALVFSFARNASKFHRKDGKGYEFLSEMVLQLDKFNPQIAARACSFLIEWEKLDNDYQIQMKKQLQRIYETPGLSVDTHEICAKGLAA